MVGVLETSRSLLHRIHQRYQTLTVPLRFGDFVLDFTRIADPEVVLDQVCEAEDRREKLGGAQRKTRLICHIRRSSGTARGRWRIGLHPRTWQARTYWIWVVDWDYVARWRRRVGRR